MTRAAATTTARERILVTAERLIAEQGAAVSLREITAGAGQRNTSAVHYHFGNRDTLITAIVTLRMQSLERERMAILAEQEAQGRTDLRSLVEALLAPMFTAPYEDGGAHYARFLEKVRDHVALSERGLTENEWPATTIIVTRISRALAPLPVPARKLRLRAMMTTVYALLADVERARDSGRPSLEVDDLVELLVGMLTASTRASR